MKIVVTVFLIIPFAFGVRHGVRAHRSPDRSFLEYWDDASRAYAKQENRIRQYLP